MAIIFIVTRIIFGLYFIYSGVNHFIQLKGSAEYARFKKIPAPKLAVIVTGLMLVVGGLGFVLWQFMYLAAFLLFVFLIITAITMHNFWSETDPQQKAMQKIQFLKNVALAVSIILIVTLYSGIGVL